MLFKNFLMPPLLFNVSKAYQRGNLLTYFSGSKVLTSGWLPLYVRRAYAIVSATVSCSFSASWANEALVGSWAEDIL
jgi:hypothetical protein